MLEPYLPHLQVGSSARDGIEAGGPNIRDKESAQREAAGSERSRTGACWTKCQVAPQVGGCTEGWGEAQAVGCTEQWQQQMPGLRL